MSKTHTATPWEFTNYTKFDGSPIQTAQDVAEITAESALKSDIAELWGVSIPGPDGPVICYTGNGPTSRANAEFIARACNAHAGLVEALTQALDRMEMIQDIGSSGFIPKCSGAIASAKAAIAKAEAANA